MASGDEIKMKKFEILKSHKLKVISSQAKIRDSPNNTMSYQLNSKNIQR